MKLGLAQIDIVWEDKEKNKKICERYIDKAVSDEVDILFFPEMTLTGFSMAVEKIGEVSPFETVSWFREEAKMKNIAIGFGFAEKMPNSRKGRNHFVIISSRGKVIYDYVKIHPFSLSGENKHFLAGKKVLHVRLDNIRIAGFICYDLRFPEVFSRASENCHLIFVIANWPAERQEHWVSLLRARAIEGQLYVCGVNRIGNGGGLAYKGNSMLIGPDGKVIIDCGKEAILGIAEVSLREVINCQKKLPFKRDRRNQLYHQFYH